MSIKYINSATVLIECEGKRFYLTDKTIKANKMASDRLSKGRNGKVRTFVTKAFDSISELLMFIVLLALLMSVIYAFIAGPYDYWTRRGDEMVKYHVDWHGNEEIIDSYQLYQ